MPLKFSPRIKDHGLHVTGNRAWQMIPVGKRRELIVRGTKDRTLQVRDPSIIKVIRFSSGNSDRIKIVGLKAGRTLIDWVLPKPNLKPGAINWDPRPSTLSLEVSVKKQKIIRTVFHYVDDGRVQKTKRKPSNAAALIEATNKILIAQANVKLTLRNTKILKIKKNLGKVVRFSSHLKGVPKSQHEWDDVVKHADKKADFNVFFVKEFEQDDTPFKDNTEASVIMVQKNCIFEDNLTGHSAGTVLAHETVHLLGVHEHSKVTSNLMSESGSGKHLNERQINTVNPSGTR